MTSARVRLAVAAGLFFGWLGWLGYAVSQKGRAAVVSRAQLTAATHLIVADVAAGPDGRPAPTVTVAEAVRGDGPPAGSRVEVPNLAAAQPPGANGFPGPGMYLLPVVRDGNTYPIAGLPRSPGYEPSAPARPAIYPWTDDTKAQLRGLGLVP